MQNKRSLVVFLILMVVLAFELVIAQELPTLEAETPTPEVIDGESPPVVTEEPPATVAAEQPPDPVIVVRDTSTTLTELIAAFLAGGIVVGGGVLIAIRSVIKLFSDNPALKAAVERLYLSQPVSRRRGIRPIIETGQELFTLLEDLTDEELAEVEAQAAALRTNKP